jgi:hypothetical protein
MVRFEPEYFKNESIGFRYILMSLNSLILEPTKKTPWIVLEPGKVIILGRSILENPPEFYRPIHEWVSKYAEESSSMTVINLGFEFINTTSIKWVYAILKELARIPDMNLRAKISWYYEVGDEDMCDLGFILKSLVNCPFTIVEVEDLYKQKLA